MRLADLTGSVT